MGFTQSVPFSMPKAQLQPVRNCVGMVLAWNQSSVGFRDIRIIGRMVVCVSTSLPVLGSPPFCTLCIPLWDIVGDMLGLYLSEQSEFDHLSHRLDKSDTVYRNIGDLDEPIRFEHSRRNHELIPLASSSAVTWLQFCQMPRESGFDPHIDRGKGQEGRVPESLHCQSVTTNDSRPSLGLDDL